MADLDLYFPKVIIYEGGYVEDKDDKGGATNMGITLNTWREMGYDKDGDGDIDHDDIKALTKDDAKMVCKSHYWDRWMADKINDQKVAEQLVDWLWCSGKWGVIIPQRTLGINPDGVVGHITIDTVNRKDPAELHATIVSARLAFIDKIIANNPTQKKFKNGWTNRIKSL